MIARVFQIGVLGIVTIAFLLLGRNMKCIMQPHDGPARPSRAHGNVIQVIEKQGQTDAKALARTFRRGA